MMDQVPETPEVEIPKEEEILQSIEISKPADIKLVEPMSLPQVTSTTDSPTFQSIMDQPFTTIFSTQSTDPPNPSSPVAETMAIDEETDNEGFGGTFEALSFDEAEEDFPDHMLMTMKQFKILNSKLNSILQSQANVGSTGINILEVDSLMKEMGKVLVITKERHVLFVQEVKKVREDVNMQIRELREEMMKEVQHIQQGYESTHQKIDIICDAVVQCVKMFEPVNPQMISLSATEEQHFGELVKLLKELKEISSKSSSPIISQEFLSQKFVHFEAILQKHLTPLLRISSLLPNVSDAPPTVTGVQGGEKRIPLYSVKSKA
ncbi:unnamed protein product [Lactuca saligna]|uniref:Uncharacterized protein n=1 Tax=Lactuca saligna TaxID=75948 RepID=A0AA35YCC8_LACSI|nr:unnamed protein product [Lactuca saligna]